MKDDTIHDQAVHLEDLLPRLMRRMFTLEPNSEAHNMPIAQFRVCAILQAGPRTLSAISEELSISVSATTQIADRMERAALVERTVGTDDRRTKNLQLTAHGQEIMQNRRLTRIRRAEQALAHLSPEDRETILHAVQILLDASIATAPEPPKGDPVGVRQQQG